MSKNGFIDYVSIGSPCTADWDKMVGSDMVRTCEHCAKDVNNLSEMTRKDAKRLVRASDGNICIRYMKHPVSKRPVFADQMIQITRRAPGIAAGVMTASVSLSTLAYAQGGVSFSSPMETTKVEKLKDPVDNETTKQIPTSGVLEVTVVDPAGAVIGGATVNIHSADSTPEFQTSGTTNSDGYVAFDQVPVGVFYVDASANGFRLSRDTVVVALDKNTVVNSKLEVAGPVFITGDIAISRDYATALARAVDNDDPVEVRDLISQGANVNGKDANYNNLTPLFIAVENGNLEIVEMLLNAGAKVNVRDKSRQTALMQLDVDAAPEMVELLNRHGLKLNLSDDEGNTALTLVSGGVSTEVLRALIDAGADVNLANKEGKTPLMRAAEAGHLENVRLLLESGANVNARDKEGENAWYYAEEDAVEQLLVTYGVEVSPDEDEGKPSDDPKLVISR